MKAAMMNNYYEECFMCNFYYEGYASFAASKIPIA